MVAGCPVRAGTVDGPPSPRRPFVDGTERKGGRRMRTWIALLRGINVGGHKKIPMAALREACTDIGFADVTTYIQSGNVVFRAEGSGDDIARSLRSVIGERFDCDVPVVLRTVQEMERVAGANPFLEEGADAVKLHVGFLLDEPDEDRVAELPAKPPGPEAYRVVGADVYLHYPAGMGKSKLTTAWFDRALGTRMTVRNWRTVNKLVAMAREVDARPL
jgi:uncharacterized protein (DUF1697 family)